eukprot:10832190-Alexandrium_andersonii.AAC.1
MATEINLGPQRGRCHSVAATVCLPECVLTSGMRSALSATVCLPQCVCQSASADEWDEKRPVCHSVSAKVCLPECKCALGEIHMRAMRWQCGGDHDNQCCC